MVPHDVSNGIFYTQNLFKPYFLFLFTNKSTVVKDASMFLHLLKNFFDEAVVKYTKYIWTFDIEGVGKHTIYSRNNMGQKCEGNCGLLVFNETIKKIYPEKFKKIVGAVWELSAK